ncbi:hypothetical protein EYB53_003205 [Candidatus Chloroploca sp. M-50]|uniref:Uncharacterized protein n=1 Tax=Candidatus Chloroploca mongolica TaxID=2528176 RepID=A0ABS4D5J1_9CHLR|nr:hypothetical protein [Candidatus Chloroploca mongolica]MBP1464711.1 hypothetical protein [Candidatus Chloroploca mongolica]
MEMLSDLQSILIGLIGWAATTLMLENASRLTITDRRVMSVFSWTIWMIPAFGALVLQGLLTTYTAVLYVCITTLALGVIMVIGVSRRTHTRS